MEFLSQTETIRNFDGTPCHVTAGSRDTIRVLVVDDQAAFRYAIVRMLGDQQDISVIGEAADAETATFLTRQKHPDVILMDFSMPGLNGAQATHVIHSELPDIQIIGLSMYGDLDHAGEMLTAGAVNYVAKDCSSDTLLDAIRAAGDGGVLQPRA